MGISVSGGSVDGFVQAAHSAFTVPVEPGQGTGVAKAVLLRVARHVQPVNTPYKFPPSDDLADKTLHGVQRDRKSTRLNSSHVKISYAVFCLKKKKKTQKERHTTFA